MKMNKKSILVLVLAALAAPLLSAQNLEETGDELEHTGTEVQVDSTLLGRDIFSALPEQVIVRQPPPSARP